MFFLYVLTYKLTYIVINITVPVVKYFKYYLFFLIYYYYYM